MIGIRIVDRVIESRELGNDDHRHTSGRKQDDKDRSPPAGLVFPKAEPAEKHYRNICQDPDQEQVTKQEKRNVRDLHHDSGHATGPSLADIEEKIGKKKESRHDGEICNDDLRLLVTAAFHGTEDRGKEAEDRFKKQQCYLSR